jgi:hypothetical protein
MTGLPSRDQGHRTGISATQRRDHAAWFAEINGLRSFCESLFIRGLHLLAGRRSEGETVRSPNPVFSATTSYLLLQSTTYENAAQEVAPPHAQGSGGRL